MKGILSHTASKHTGKINPVKVKSFIKAEQGRNTIIYMYRLFPLINVFQDTMHTLNKLHNFQGNMVKKKKALKKYMS